MFDDRKMSVDSESFQRLRLEHLALRHEHDVLRNEVDMLLQSLKEHGIVHGPSSRHTRPPRAMPRAFADVLAPETILGTLGFIRGAGRGRALSNLRQASKACRDRADDAPSEVYVFGGEDADPGTGMNSAERFDPCTGEWTPLPPMKLKRNGSIAAMLGGRIFVCGGYSALHRVVEEYIPSQQRWDATPPVRKLNASRFMAASATLDGRLYIMGGEDVDTGTVLDTVECLDPRRKKGDSDCEVLPYKLVVPRRYHAAASFADKDKKILAVHGGSCRCIAESKVKVQGHIQSSFETLDLSKKKSSGWKLGASFWPLMGHSCFVVRKSLFLCGGHYGNDVPVDTMFKLDLDTNTCALCVPMLRTRMHHAAVRTGGRLLVLGGNRGSKTKPRPSYADMDMFSPEQGTWESMPDMLQPRQCFAVAAGRLGSSVTE